MGIYSTNFFNGTINSGQVSVYTVPVASVVVIRDIEVYVGGTSSTGFNFSSSVSGLSAVIWLLTGTPGNWYQWQGRAVMPEGAELLTYGGGSTYVQALISGYLLT